MSRIKKSAVGTIVQDYNAKGKSEWERRYRNVCKLEKESVKFYNVGTSQSGNIEIGDNVYVLHSGFKTNSYADCLDKLLNNETVVYVKKVESTDTFDNYTKSAVESRTFISRVQTLYGNFYETTGGSNTFDIEFSDVWIPVSSVNAITQSSLSSYYCKEYNNAYINCEYKDATHVIIDFSYFDETRNDTVSSQIYKPSLCCLVKLTRQLRDDMQSVKLTSEWSDGQATAHVIKNGSETSETITINDSTGKFEDIGVTTGDVVYVSNLEKWEAVSNLTVNNTVVTAIAPSTVSTTTSGKTTTYSIYAKYYSTACDYDEEDEVWKNASGSLVYKMSTNNFQWNIDDFFIATNPVIGSGVSAYQVFCWNGVTAIDLKRESYTDEGTLLGYYNATPDKASFKILKAEAPLAMFHDGNKTATIKINPTHEGLAPLRSLYLQGTGINISSAGVISCTVASATYTAGNGISIEDGEISCTLTTPTYSQGANIAIDANNVISCTLTGGDGITVENGVITNTRSYTEGTNINIAGGVISCTLEPPTYSQGTNIAIDANNVISCTLDPQTLTQGFGLSIDANDVISWNGVACDNGAFRTLEVESPLTLDVDGTTATLGIDTTGLDGTVYTPGTYIAITNGRIDCTLTPTTYTPGSGISIEDGEISCTLTQTTYTAGDNINITNGRINCALFSGTYIQIDADGSINCTLTPTFSLQAYSESSGAWGLAQSDGADLYNASTSAFRYDSGDFSTNSDGVFRWSGVRSTDGNGGAFRTLNATGAASLSFSGDVATLDVEEPPEYEVRAAGASDVTTSTVMDADGGIKKKVFTLSARIILQAYAKNATTDVWALATSGSSNVYNHAIAAFKYDNEDFETNASDVFCWRGVDSDDGRFTKLEIDSTSPLSLDVANGVATLGLETSGLGGATYTAGGGINIDSDNEITATGGFTWAVWDGSEYVDGATLIANERRTMYFGRQFKRGALQGDTVGGTEVEIDTTSKTFMTGATLTPTLLGSVPTTFTLYKVTNGVASATSEYMIQPGGYVNVFSYALTPTTGSALCLARTK